MTGRRVPEDTRAPMLANASTENSLYTGATSTCVRAVALAVIAVAWLFLDDGETSAGQALHDAHKHLLVTWALTLAVASLALDALHYAAGALLSQFNENMIDEVLADRHLRKATVRTQFAWQRAAATGFVDALLRATKNNTTHNTARRDTAVAKAQQLIADHYALARGAAVTMGAGFDSSEDKLVVAFMARVRPARGIVGITRTLFWLKTSATVAAGVLIVVFCLRDLIN